VAGPGQLLRPALVVGALGVVFGDIGTSPIYTFQTVFSPADPHPVPQQPDNIYGVVSLIFWSITLIVTVTYVLLAMRVDNDGEGGIMALITLTRRWATLNRSRVAAALAVLGVLGAALFLGDSMITPAISVLSAVEGLKVVDPHLDPLVIPITVVIIIALFMAQRFGTAVVGRLFGPVMVLWFVVLAILGILGIAKEPGILRAISPTYALSFAIDRPGIAFFALAAVVLSVTGAEALYADMGHFGRRPISVAWIFLVFPACALNYLGQGALALDDPAHLTAPFFLLVPSWGRGAMVVLATAATVIAAQSVISGAFSVTAQAARLGYLPRIRVLHTSAASRGQIYVPWINWLLMVSVTTLVFAFRSSAALAFAYGMAVTGTIAITTVLFFYAARHMWRTPQWLLIVGAVLLLTLDLLYVAVNLTKFLHGAWVPLVIALCAFTIMTTWQRGRVLVTARRNAMEGDLKEFVSALRSNPRGVHVVDGTAIFLNRGKTTPLALRANVEHNHVRHRHVAIVSVLVDTVPRVPEEERATIDHLGRAGDGIAYVTLRFGYTEQTDVPAALATLTPDQTEGRLDLDQATYFLSKIALHPDPEIGGMSLWRKRLFVATSHITAEAGEQFHLPRDRVVLLGSNIEV
jgi:KUP system potassium uptake protein